MLEKMDKKGNSARSMLTTSECPTHEYRRFSMTFKIMSYEYVAAYIIMMFGTRVKIYIYMSGCGLLSGSCIILRPSAFRYEIEIGVSRLGRLAYRDRDLRRVDDHRWAAGYHGSGLHVCNRVQRRD